MRATMKDSRGAPPRVTQPVKGESGCPNASRPHPRPPQGKRERSHSWSTQTVGTAIGHHRNSSTTLSAHPMPAYQPAITSARASQASGPSTLSQCSSGRKKAHPPSNPSSAARPPG